MPSTLKRIQQWLSEDGPIKPSLPGSLVGTLVQSFENCRPGLSTETIAGGEEAAGRYFADLYEKEIPRLTSMVKVQQSHLPAGARARFLEETLELLRKVVVPAYTRLALGYTPRERNAFYLLPEGLHGLERVGWGVAGILVGAFVIWAPFIPIWSKEFILPFMIAGLIFPNLRQLYSTLRYESDLEKIVTKADDEIGRIELAYLTNEPDAGFEPLEMDSAQRNDHTDTLKE